MSGRQFIRRTKGDQMDVQQQQVVGAALTAHEGMAGALLPILHQIQATLGFVPPACVPQKSSPKVAVNSL